MSYLKNTAGQKVAVFAINSATTLPVTGDASNITAKISKDFAASASLSDTNPVELDATDFEGVYVFDLTQSETDADIITLHATSTTANVQMDIINIYTVDPATYKADVSGLATAIALGITDGKCTSILTDTGTTIPAQITGLNNFDPATDVVANVTLVDTTTTNTDMVGTNNAALASSLSITNSSVNTIRTVTNALPDSGALTSLATASDLATVDTVVDAIKAKTDQFVFTVANQVDANALTGGGGDDAATIYTYFTSGTNEDAFKADVSALATASSITALNNFDPSTDTVVASNMRGTDNAFLAASAPTNFAALGINVSGHVSRVVLADTVTTNTDMRGTDSAALASNLSITNSNVNTIKSTTDQFVFTIANQVDANALTGGGGTGSGAWTVTVTVTDDSAVALLGATVRLTDGVNTFFGTSDSSGEIVFNVDSGTYTVAITKSGYSFSGASLSVSSDTAQTYAITEMNISPPGDPTQITGYLTVYDTELNLLTDRSVWFRLRTAPTSTSSYAFVKGWFQGVPNAVTGLIEVPLLLGATYEYGLIQDAQQQFTTPTEGSSYALPNLIDQTQ